jgi:hypothetical protein
MICLQVIPAMRARWILPLAGLIGLACSFAAIAQPQPVAEIFGKKLFASDLAATPGSAPGSASGETARGKALRDRVWSAVFADYARNRKVEPSEAEIVSNIENHRRMKAQAETERRSQLDKLKAELASPDLTATRRKQAETHLNVLNQIAEFERKYAQEYRDPDRQKMLQESERRVAVQWVRSWKINQTLFREFGGRIIFQQAGWEPIDAYRKLIERYEANRSFVVHDAGLRAAVYGYFDHRFVYADEAMARFYFEKPYWERSKEEMRAAGF